VPSVMRLDIRVGFPLGWTPDEAESLVREHLARVASRDPWLSDHPPRIRPNGFRAEGYDLSPDHPLAALLAAAHRQAHGVDPASIRMASTTDARTYLNLAGVPAVCYGPRTERIHGIDERVELASIIAGARTLTRFLVAFPAAYRAP
jgi:acetylornithine deacetylase